MTQTQRRAFLIDALLKEQPRYSHAALPANEEEQKRLLRSLFNRRPPRPAGREFLAVQDAYLQEEIRRRGITDFSSLRPIQPGLYLWQGDITTLRCDAIVNAANSRMLGCFCPNHGCIDNAVHTFAGVQLRWACEEMMRRQGHEEKAGGAKATPAYNLPCSYVLHTVGPVVQGRPSEKEENQLASCYRSCLELAEKYALKSVAFCCIATGEYHFPEEPAAKIAIRTVKAYKARTHSKIEVVFNVFKDADYQVYRNLLRSTEKAETKP
ncbi:MAG TPA: protein-ADP-ribose hydrolase [Firmicutes bacterium]|nr:protein-ADP-ribose hydrolase [Bacillota bacterium]